jgi:SAM-dependent methyltransferase
MIKYLDIHFRKVKSSFKTRGLIFRDALDVFLGLRHPLMPPKRYDYINIGINETIGKEFLEHFINKAALISSHRVLEVGSGFGRIAIPLTQFLNTQGRYEGLEIIKDGVNWCQSNFTTKFPNFNFQRIDVKNERYHPLGKYKASEYKFPFENASFDFVYLTSVFTHMYPDEIENYTKEIARVLKKGGHCFISYYLLNDISLDNISKHKGTYNFKYELEDYRIEDKANPLYQIAFHENYIKKLYKTFKLEIKGPIHYGSWSGRQDNLSFQDIIVGKKL